MGWPAWRALPSPCSWRNSAWHQYDGTLDIRNALGLAGTVYLTVPAARQGPGKVNVLVQEQLREFDAVTDSAGAIPTGADIVVTGLAGRDTLLVAPKRQEPNSKTNL